MAAYSPPATTTMDPDIRENLLKCLEDEINATQKRHDEVQKAICKRRWATQFRPEQFEDATLQDNTTPMGRVRDYSFNLRGITPPQPPKWKQIDQLYEDFKKFK